VLRGISFISAGLWETRAPADFTALRAMLVFLGDYPERAHHPREEKELFAVLRGRDSELDGVLTHLHEEHVASLACVMRLEHQVNRAEFGAPEELTVLRRECDRLVAQYLAHIEIEEREVLTRAERLLTEAEWAAIAAELKLARDPLAGLARDAEFERLFRTIAQLVPTPIGLRAARRVARPVQGSST